jgi:hypothetical protein
MSATCMAGMGAQPLLLLLGKLLYARREVLVLASTSM